MEIRIQRKKLHLGMGFKFFLTKLLKNLNFCVFDMFNGFSDNSLKSAFEPITPPQSCSLQNEVAYFSIEVGVKTLNGARK